MIRKEILTPIFSTKAQIICWAGDGQGQEEMSFSSCQILSYPLLKSSLCCVFETEGCSGPQPMTQIAGFLPVSSFCPISQLCTR